MKRDYDNGSSEGVVFFTGIEIEHTPAYGQNTLFVTGVQSKEAIATYELSQLKPNVKAKAATRAKKLKSS